MPRWLRASNHSSVCQGVLCPLVLFHVSKTWTVLDESVALPWYLVAMATIGTCPLIKKTHTKRGCGRFLGPATPPARASPSCRLWYPRRPRRPRGTPSACRSGTTPSSGRASARTRRPGPRTSPCRGRTRSSASRRTPPSRRCPRTCPSWTSSG